jgi:hypothetical protein
MACLRCRDHACASGFDDRPQPGHHVTSGAADVSHQYRPGTKPSRVGAENGVTLCDLGVFVDQAAEPVPAHNVHAGHATTWQASLGSARRYRALFAADQASRLTWH